MLWDTHVLQCFVSWSKRSLISLLWLATLSDRFTNWHRWCDSHLAKSLDHICNIYLFPSWVGDTPCFITLQPLLSARWPSSCLRCNITGNAPPLNLAFQLGLDTQLRTGDSLLRNGCSLSLSLSTTFPLVRGVKLHRNTTGRLSHGEEGADEGT